MENVEGKIFRFKYLLPFLISKLYHIFVSCLSPQVHLPHVNELINLSYVMKQNKVHQVLRCALIIYYFKHTFSSTMSRQIYSFLTSGIF